MCVVCVCVCVSQHSNLSKFSLRDRLTLSPQSHEQLADSSCNRYTQRNERKREGRMNVEDSGVSGGLGQWCLGFNRSEGRISL